MKLFTGVLVVTTLAAGGSGAAFAYANALGDLPAAVSTPHVTAPATNAPPPQRPVVTQVRFRPCPAGDRVEHGACVRHVVRTVVAPPTAAPTAAATTQRTTQPATSGSNGASSGATHGVGHHASQTASAPTPGQGSGGSDDGSQSTGHPSGSQSPPPTGSPEPGDD